VMMVGGNKLSREYAIDFFFFFWHVVLYNLLYIPLVSGLQRSFNSDFPWCLFIRSNTLILFHFIHMNRLLAEPVHIIPSFINRTLYIQG
jgi:hypothetical protein